jgi:hypothetical protein
MTYKIIGAVAGIIVVVQIAAPLLFKSLGFK